MLLKGCDLARHLAMPQCEAEGVHGDVGLFRRPDRLRLPEGRPSYRRTEFTVEFFELFVPQLSGRGMKGFDGALCDLMRDIGISIAVATDP